MDLVFSFLCHQIPGRSPHLGHEVFPLCFRCTGLYLGIFAAYSYLIFSGGLRRSFPKMPSLIMMATLMMPFIIDGVGNKWNLWDTQNLLRAMSGLIYGAALPLLLVPIARPLDAASTKRKPTLTQPGMLAVPLALGLMLLTLLYRPPFAAAFQALRMVALFGFIAFLVNLAMTMRNFSVLYYQLRTTGLTK